MRCFSSSPRAAPTKEISVTLRISPKTVEFHKSGLMDELGVRTTAELTRYALSKGIITG